MKPHKHAEVIHAWADGAEIRCKSNVDGKWYDTINPQFYPYYKYRVKPVKRIPREVWVNYDLHGHYTNTLLSKAKNYKEEDWETVHFCEVMDDE